MPGPRRAEASTIGNNYNNNMIIFFEMQKQWAVEDMKEPMGNWPNEAMNQWFRESMSQ